MFSKYLNNIMLLTNVKRFMVECACKGGSDLAVDYRHMCPKYEEAAALLGKKWTGLIIRALLGEATRFSDIRRQMPELSDRLLSERLKELEAHGVIERVVRDTKPVAVEYRLTEKGLALEPVVHAIQDWADTWA